LDFLDRSSENTQPSNYMEVRPVGRVVPRGRTDGQTGMTKLTVDFRSFAKAPNNWRYKDSPTLSLSLVGI